MSQSQWQWENATAGAVAGFATVAAMYPLDIVRTRFQGRSLSLALSVFNDGRVTNFPTYKNTAHAIFTISRLEGLKGLYAGFLPAVLGSTVSWGLYFFFYGRAKQRYSKNREGTLSSGLHLASAAEAGALVSLCTNPIWLIKTRLQLQNPLNQNRRYAGIYDALRTILREEGWTALYKGLGPGLLMVSHGAIQFTAYEELRRIMVDYKARKQKSESASNLLNSFDYAVLGGSSKIAAILITYPFQVCIVTSGVKHLFIIIFSEFSGHGVPYNGDFSFQVIRTRTQQRPSDEGIPRYMNSWHVVKETTRFEGLRGFYKGITPNLLKNVPASSITFIVYENVLKLLRPAMPFVSQINGLHGNSSDLPPSHFQLSLRNH
ncbi:Folate transporter 1 [Hibiscus syriacus]|uniref:Folate transporter 1 n=1 Tax=Hibiscus syriacus TaxID=106335 RepID=A0A6A3BQ51_HIBSY|nr:Folate transporter 1 [Hibiscus syriacus]